MTTPMWVLLGFAGWTLLILLLTVGWYRWSRIFTGRAAIDEFWDDRARGADWYQRATRAHANCLENLPVYTALVVAMVATGTQGPVFDALALALLAARIAQTSTHVACRPTPIAAAFRFAFYFVQYACMVAMGCLIAVGVGARA
jgi:uncharacterized MAPEG superfamily protein